MKTYKRLYEKMLEPAEIKAAIRAAAKKKRNRRDVREVLNNIDEHVAIIQEMLKDEAFEPGQHRQVIINEDNHLKVRRIIKPRFKYEQIIHHLIARQLGPIIKKGLDPFVCGSIPNRGPHYGQRYMRKWVNRYEDRKFYVLKMDIHHFYESIDHGVLMAKLSRIIKDDQMLHLITKVISVTDNGLPIGYFTSQWFGNFYLKDLDRWIKQDIKAEHYMRYMDDLVILGRNKKQLHKMRRQIAAYLGDIGLALNSSWQVFRFESKKKEKKMGRALDFMGFVTHRGHTGIRKSNLKRIRAKANRIGRKQGATWHDAVSMLSRMGWLKHTDTYGYYKKWIKPNINVRSLKRKVSRHDKKNKRKR